MTPVTMKRLVFSLCAVTTFLICSATSYAQTRGNERRTELQDAFKTQRRERASFVGGAPSYSLTPRRDNIGFALGTEILDVAVDRPKTDTTSRANTLDMTGYAVVPTVAFFGKNLGIGFSAEAGSRSVKYLNTIDASATDPEYFFEQYSETRYNGVGLYGYLLLPKGILPRLLTTTLIVGGRSLTATEKSRGERTDPTVIPDFKTVKYDVNIVDAGLHFTLTLARRFQIIPWVNYRTTSLGAVKDPEEGGAAAMDDAMLNAVQQDRSLMWGSSNRQATYGVDLAMQFTNINVHFGGLLGYLAYKNRGAERIQDRAVNVAISYYLAPPENE